MFYTVYKTTNLTNGKYYIGIHKTKNLNDSYLGSGKILKQAILKEGRSNFKREILHIFDNLIDMENKERELVTEIVVSDSNTYNLVLGGYGGGMRTKEVRERVANSLRGRKVPQHIVDKITKTKIGKKRSEETKQKMRISRKLVEDNKPIRTDIDRKIHSTRCTKYIWNIKNIKTNKEERVFLNSWCRENNISISALKYSWNHNTSYKDWVLISKDLFNP